jgi:hypothetical protein
MNWFQRHLNWSLFFGAYLLPFIVNVIIAVIFIMVLLGGIGVVENFSESNFETALANALPFVIVAVIVVLALDGFAIFVIWWYLGRKDRSKWFLLLVLSPGIISGLTGRTSIGPIINILCSIAAIVTTIILFRLKNHRKDYSSGLSGASVTSEWPGKLPPSVLDDQRLLKELDYTPNKNVLDISGGSGIKDVGVTNDTSGTGDVSAAGIASEESQAPEKAVEKAVGQKGLKMPILMDDAGAVISCFYHPGADAVNMCSRCHQYVCAECNYITGTHPICHNCWDKRGAVPIAPAHKQEKSAPVKPQKQKVVEPTIPPEPLGGESTIPPEPLDVRPTMPQEPTDVEPARPPEPVAAEPVKAAEPEQVTPVSSEPQKIVASAKAAKQEAEKIEWQQEFMSLYVQAAPIIKVVTSKNADGMPASPLDLMEGLKLRPMLERVKKLSKPKDKELREAKGDFEQVMSGCIKIADAAANFVSSGGQALLGGPDFKRIVDGIETASGLMAKLSSRLAPFSNPQ